MASLIDYDYHIRVNREQIEDARRFNLPHLLRQGEERLSYWLERKGKASAQ